MRLPLRHLGAAIVATAATGTVVFGQPKSAPPLSTPPPQAPAGASPQQIERGRYLVALGDCVACHTQQGGARFAGGRPLETPFGVVLSANITPDKDTGIGGWTADQFYRALHEGVDDEGQHLYPAFPYNYYTRVTREDSDAMFAYLRSLPPVNYRFERNKLPFPFNVRGLMVVWNWLFLDKGEYRADASKPADWNRGAYLVEGLGHCQACHTPKNFLGGTKHDEAFRGGVFGEWFAPDITANGRTGVGRWNDDELREFLRRGLNVHSAASAEMGEVVAFSTSQMNDADLRAVMSYLRGIPASPPLQVSPPDRSVMKRGEAIWQDDCSGCHRMNGSGVPRYFPPLQHDPNVQQSNATTVLHFILAGTRRVPTDSAPTPLSMPAFFWKLDDAQIAAVATYVGNNWGNAAPTVRTDQVKELRTKLHLEQGRPEERPPTDLRHAGASTLAPPGTDSRDNGTARAGSPAASQAAMAQLPASGSLVTSGTSAAQGAASASSARNGEPQKTSGLPQQQKGHPAGVPTAGPG